MQLNTVISSNCCPVWFLNLQSWPSLFQIIFSWFVLCSKPPEIISQYLPWFHSSSINFYKMSWAWRIISQSGLANYKASNLPELLPHTHTESLSLSLSVSSSFIFYITPYYFACMLLGRSIEWGLFITQISYAYGCSRSWFRSFSSVHSLFIKVNHTSKILVFT